jgi:hypothetical protein
MTRLSLKTEFTTNDLVVNNGSADNANNGDKLRNAFGKLIKSIDRAEANFVELYAAGSVDLTGYATEDWVTSQSYITLADVPSGGTGALELQAIPASKYGAPGDTKGMVAIDSDTGDFYFCIRNYVDSNTSIWRKTSGTDAW